MPRHLLRGDEEEESAPLTEAAHHVDSVQTLAGSRNIATPSIKGMA